MSSVTSWDSAAHRNGAAQSHGGPLSGGFKTSVRMVVDPMGIARPEIVTLQDVAVATSAHHTDGSIAAGSRSPPAGSAGRRSWTAPGRHRGGQLADGRGEPRTGVEFGRARARFEIEISGDPDVMVTFTGLQPDSVAEGMRAQPAAGGHRQPLRQRHPLGLPAEPGIKTYLDLPLLAGRRTKLAAAQ